MLGNGLKPQTLLQGLVLDGEAGPGKPQVAVGVPWSLGASPVRGGDESGSGSSFLSNGPSHQLAHGWSVEGRVIFVT